MAFDAFDLLRVPSTDDLRNGELATPIERGMLFTYNGTTYVNRWEPARGVFGCSRCPMYRSVCQCDAPNIIGCYPSNLSDIPMTEENLAVLYVPELK